MKLWSLTVLKLRRLLGREPLAWAAWTLLLRMFAGVRHRCLARVLHAPGISVGRGSIFRGVRHMRFGRSFHANGAVWIEAVSSYQGHSHSPCITIGNDVSASNDLHISCIDRVSIGNGVLFGSRVYISDHNHGNYRGELQSDPSQPPALRALGGGGPVTIHDNAWIGHNVVIIGPVEIGVGAVVGANSIVRRSVPSRTIVVGAPAVEIKRYDGEARRWKRY